MMNLLNVDYHVYGYSICGCECMMDSSTFYAIIFLILVNQRDYYPIPGVVSSNVYIVYMGGRSHDDKPEQAEVSHYQILSNILESEQDAQDSILYSYKHGFSGFAAVLEPFQAATIAGIPGVVRVIPNRILSLHTTRSWDFLQVLPYRSDGILARAESAGSGSIIGVLDSGIWPESESFRDDNMGSVPPRWKGKCQGGEKFDQSNCNRKIIGARWYLKGFQAEIGNISTEDGAEFLSARDATGHGTHTSSTAGGTYVENADFLGLAKGQARGGFPSAMLAIYKVCWASGGCSTADILAAFDDAISDGVDVISMSLGSVPPLSAYIDDVVAIGSFHAVARGIPVICSGGNGGPFPQTVVNTSPWVITVAASTMDRAFPTAITLGNNITIVGQSLYVEKNFDEFYPIVYGEDIASDDAVEFAARNCDEGALNATLAQGKVILCFESLSQRSAIAAARNVLIAGGIGLIFARFPTKEVALCTDVPCTQVDFSLATTLLTYIGSTDNPVVKFSVPKTSLGKMISPEVALFSSRGPNSLSPSVLKPDVAAPGVNILAAWSPASPVLTNVDERKTQAEPAPLLFNIESGTSMSCPHVSAIVALLRAIHPTWSPAALKSALVTTASSTDEYGQPAFAEGAPHKQADSFDYGGGHVDPNKAIDPGLIFDLTTKDYLGFLCAMGYNDTAISLLTGPDHPPCPKTSNTNFLENFNLPSISIPELKHCILVSRTATNVGHEGSVYFVRVESPPGIDVEVYPPALNFDYGGKKRLKFKVRICPRLRVQGNYVFGNLFWEDGFGHLVKLPLIVRPVIDNFVY